MYANLYTLHNLRYRDRKVEGYGKKRGELSERLEQLTLSQAWAETSLKVQRILAETKELYSMSVMPTRAPWSKDMIYAELRGDTEILGINKP